MLWHGEVNAVFEQGVFEFLDENSLRCRSGWKLTC